MSEQMPNRITVEDVTPESNRETYGQEDITILEKRNMQMCSLMSDAIMFFLKDPERGEYLTERERTELLSTFVVPCITAVRFKEDYVDTGVSTKEVFEKLYPAFDIDKCDEHPLFKVKGILRCREDIPSFEDLMSEKKAEGDVSQIPPIGYHKATPEEAIGILREEQ